MSGRFRPPGRSGWRNWRPRLSGAAGQFLAQLVRRRANACLRGVEPPEIGRDVERLGAPARNMGVEQSAGLGILDLDGIGHPAGECAAAAGGLRARVDDEADGQNMRDGGKYRRACFRAGQGQPDAQRARPGLPGELKAPAKGLGEFLMHVDGERLPIGG